MQRCSARQVLLLGWQARPEVHVASWHPRTHRCVHMVYITVFSAHVAKNTAMTV